MAYGALLSLIGTGLESAGKARVTRMRSESIADELARQAGFQDQATAGLADALRGVRAPSASYLRTRAPSLTPVSAGDVPMTGSAPASVKANLAKMMGRALERGKDTARSRSRLGGTKRQVGQGVQTITDLGLDLDLLRDYARGSVGALGEELGADNQQGFGALADIFKSVGSVSGGS